MRIVTTCAYKYTYTYIHVHKTYSNICHSWAWAAPTETEAVVAAQCRGHMISHGINHGVSYVPPLPLRVPKVHSREFMCKRFVVCFWGLENDGRNDIKVAPVLSQNTFRHLLNNSVVPEPRPPHPQRGILNLCAAGISWVSAAVGGGFLSLRCGDFLSFRFGWKWFLEFPFRLAVVGVWGAFLEPDDL